MRRFENTLDAVVMVYAPLELRVKRAMQRDNATSNRCVHVSWHNLMTKKNEVGQILRFWNDGTVPLLPQLTQVIEELKSGKFV